MANTISIIVLCFLYIICLWEVQGDPWKSGKTTANESVRFFMSNDTETWEKAGKICVTNGGHLLNEDILYKHASEIRNLTEKNIVWTALLKEFGYIQSVVPLPHTLITMPTKLKWVRSSVESPTEGCVVFKRSSLQVYDCSSRKKFVCWRKKPPEEHISDGCERDLELQLTLKPRETSKHHVRLSSTEIDSVYFECKGSDNVTWVKNGIYVGETRPVLNVKDADNTTTNNYTCSLQGTYWCETWLSNCYKRFKSNNITITIKNVVTVLMYTYKTEKNELNDSSRNLYSSVQLTPEDALWASRCVEYGIGTAGKKVYVYTTHIYFDNTLNDVRVDKLLEVRDKKIIPVAESKDDYHLFTLTTCEEVNVSYLAEAELMWPTAEAGARVESNDSKCDIRRRGIFRDCVIDCFDKSANWSSVNDEELQCKVTTLLICPPDYDYLAPYCIRISKHGAWHEAYRDCFQTGVGKTPIDLEDYWDIRDSLLKKMRNENVSSIWLAAQRKRNGGPIIYSGFWDSIFQYTDYKGKFKWANNEPNREYNCMTFDPFENTLQMSPCERKLPFVCIFQNETKSSLQNFTCPPGWASNKEIIGKYDIYLGCSLEEKNIVVKDSNVTCQGMKGTLRNVSLDMWQSITSRLSSDWTRLTSNGYTYEFLYKQFSLFATRNIDGVYICSKSVTRQEAKIDIEIQYGSSISIDTTGTLNKEFKIRCYINGRGIEPCSFESCSYDINNLTQGYFFCEAFATSPPKLIQSNPILVERKSTYGYRIEIHNNTEYKPEEHDLTYNNIPVSYLADKIQNYIESLEFSHINISVLNCSENLKLELLIEITVESDSISDEYRIFEILSNVSEFSSVRSTSWCFRNTTGEGRNKFKWPDKTIGLDAYPENGCRTERNKALKRKCEGDFYSGASWSRIEGVCAQNLTENTGEIIELANSENKTDETLWEKLKQKLDKSTDPLVDADISLSFVKNSYEDGVNVIGMKWHNIINSVIQVSEESENAETSPLVNKMIQLIDDVLLDRKGLSNGSYSLNVRLSEVSLISVSVKEDEKLAGFNFAPDSEGITTTNKSLSTEEDMNEKALISVYVPSALTQVKSNEKPIQISFAVYENTKLFPKFLDDTVKSYKLVSNVIQLSVKDDVNDLDQPLIIYFKSNISENGTPKCVFWDMKDDGGYWNDSGCTTYNFKWNVKCSCNHLSCFALLLKEDTFISAGQKDALSILTYVGCSLSLLGLALVFITFLLFKKWRTFLANRILVNLSLPLFLFYLVYLTGFTYTSNQTVCTVTAVVLHYLILVAFGWMFVEALDLYLKFVVVVGGHISRFVLKAFLISWGVPLIPVICVLGYDVNEYGDAGGYCWIKSNVVTYVAFVAPFSLILCANIFVFVRILVSVTCRGRKPTSTSEQNANVIRFWMSAVMFVLLGFSWLFGVLCLSKQIIFTYLFCITSSLQGFLIFIFFVLRDKRSRSMWISFLSPCLGKRRREAHSMQTTASFSMSTSETTSKRRGK